MSTKVSLGNGKYCYSGPNCEWHSAKGAANVKNAIREAQKKVSFAREFNDMVTASEELKEAIERYNSTDEGLAKLKEDYKNSQDDLEKANLTGMISRAEAKAEEINKQEQLMWSDVPGDKFTLPATHTYEEPTFSVPNPGMYESTVGNKHGRYLRSAELTKNIRADLKEAQAKGYLPRGVKFSVTKEDYSGGRSIKVAVTGMDNTALYGREFKDKQEMYDALAQETRKSGYTENAQEILERVENITNAYNSQAIHGQIDYFNVDYYARVSLEDSFDREYRETVARRGKKIRAGKAISKNVKESIARNGESETIAKEFTPKLHTSDGTLIHTKDRVIMMETEKGREFYDLSGLYHDSDQEWMDAVSKASTERIRTRLRKKKIA